MTTATGLTAPRMLEIESNSIVYGEIDIYGDLILTTRGGETINAGQVEASRLFTITDTTTVDLVLTGNGSLGTPWNLQANVKQIDIDAARVVTGTFDINRIPNLTATAVLEGTYRGGPTAKVKVGGILSSVAYSWMSPYVPNASRVVRLMRTGSTWMITGQVPDGDVPLALTASSSSYADIMATPNFSSSMRATLLPSGIVVLSGLGRMIGSLADGTVLFTLPAGYRPDNDMLYAIEVNDAAATIRINASGTVAVYGTWAAGSYYSLDSIAFPAAGVATWTAIGSGGSAWGSSFGPDASWVTTFGTPGFWKDPYGMVWFRGLAKLLTTVTVDNTNICTLPTTHQADFYQHIRTNGNNLHSGVGAGPGVGLQWKVNSVTAAGNWISLASVLVTTAEGRANNPWVYPGGFVNSWVNYNYPSFNRAGYVRREDGLCLASGLLGSGTVGTRAFWLKEKELWPANGRSILSTITSTGRARLDIGGDRETLGGQNEPGSVVFTQGASPWYSLDGTKWVP